MSEWALEEPYGGVIPPPQQYRLRLCRAIVLVALGAGMHLPMLNSSAGPTPTIPPRPFVRSDAVRTRPAVIQRSVVFAPQLFELDRRARRTISPVALGATPARNVVAHDRSRSLDLQRARVDEPASVPERTTAAELNNATGPASAPSSDEGVVVPATLSNASGEAAPIEPPRVLPTAGRASEEDRVRRLIDEYAGALERLDVGAAKAVWPTVDGKALKRAFGQLSAQRLTLQSCGITISGSTANARCRGSATYQPRIGTRSIQIASREWTFDLSKQDADWRIVNTLVR